MGNEKKRPQKEVKKESKSDGKTSKTVKKGSKNALENRHSKFVDSRGEAVMLMTLGKKRIVFLKDGIYHDATGKEIDLDNL